MEKNDLQYNLTIDRCLWSVGHPVRGMDEGYVGKPNGTEQKDEKADGVGASGEHSDAE